MQPEKEAGLVLLFFFWFATHKLQEAWMWCFRRRMCWWISADRCAYHSIGWCRCDRMEKL